MSIDKKDFRILYELDKNARQSLATIGRNVGLPKNVVAYRIKKLEDAGIIRNFYAVVDASRLGYFSIRFYIKFQNTNPGIEKEIVGYFEDNPFTWWVASIEPLFDLAVIIWVKDVKEFHTFWEETLSRYGRYFQRSRHSIYVEAVYYKHEYLLHRKYKEEGPDVIGGKEKIEVDDLERGILMALAKDARAPVTDIAKRLSTSPKVVQYRLKRLLRNNVIMGFRSNIDLLKLGYDNFRLNIFFSDFSRKREVEAFIAQNPALVFINRTVGDAHLECELHFRTLEDLHHLIDEIKDRFSESIRYQDYFIFKKVHKQQFMPLQ